MPVSCPKLISRTCLGSKINKTHKPKKNYIKESSATCQTIDRKLKQQLKIVLPTQVLSLTELSSKLLSTLSKVATSKHLKRVLPRPDRLFLSKDLYLNRACNQTTWSQIDSNRNVKLINTKFQRLSRIQSTKQLSQTNLQCSKSSRKVMLCNQEVKWESNSLASAVV